MFWTQYGHNQMSKPRITIRKTPKIDGTCPLYLQFSDKGYKFRQLIGLDMNPEEWDQERQVVKGRSTLSKRYNLIIQKALAKANDIITVYHLSKKVLTPKIFKEEFIQDVSRDNFLDYWEKEMQSQYNRRIFGDAVLVAEKRTLEKLKVWNKGSALLFSEINRKRIESFDEWHTKDLESRGFEGNRERDKSLRQIKKYLECARSDGKEFVDPFENFRWPRWKREFTYVEESELRILIDMFNDKEILREAMRQKAVRHDMRPFDVLRYTTDKSVNNMWLHLVAFLFQCFTGVRDSDLRSLTYENIEGDLLVFTPIKTIKTSGKTVYFPLTPFLRQLIITPSPGPLVKVASNQKYNKALKNLADIAKIPKVLTSHTGRHTFGSIMASKGVSLVSLTDLMGVTNVRTVMIYAHSSLDQQRTELRKAQREFMGNPKTTNPETTNVFHPNIA